MDENQYEDKVTVEPQPEKKSRLAWYIGAFIVVAVIVVLYFVVSARYTPKEIINNTVINNSVVEKVPLYQAINENGTLDDGVFVSENDTFKRINLTGNIVNTGDKSFNLSNCEVVTCDCAKNTTTPCMAMCYDCGAN